MIIGRKIITSVSNWSREMKVYRNRNSSKIKTTIAMERSSKCGLAAEQQIKLSIVGILVLMVVQCIGATGTNINSFIVIFLCFSLRFFFFHETQNERRNLNKKIISLRSLLKHVNFSCCYEFVCFIKKRFYALNSWRRDV